MVEQLVNESHLCFRQYPDEPLNHNIREAKIKGNLLHLSLDSSSLQIALPDVTIQSYKSGDLPLNTLANAVYKQIEVANQKTLNTNGSENSQEKTNTIHL